MPLVDVPRRFAQSVESQGAEEQNLTFSNMTYSIYIVALVFGAGSSLRVFRCSIAVIFLLTRRLTPSGCRVAPGVAANRLTVGATKLLLSE